MSILFTDSDGSVVPEQEVDDCIEEYNYQLMYDLEDENDDLVLL